MENVAIEEFLDSVDMVATVLKKLVA
jgi:hypothetical protein